MHILKSADYISVATVLSVIFMVISSFFTYPYVNISLWQGFIFFSLVLSSIVFSLLLLRRTYYEFPQSFSQDSNESALYDSWATRVGALSVVYGLTILKGPDDSRLIREESALVIIYIVVAFLAVGAIEAIYKYAKEVARSTYKNPKSWSSQAKLIIKLVGVFSSAMVILFISIPEIGNYFGYYDPFYHGFLAITVLTVFSSGLALVNYNRNKIKKSS